MEKYNIVFYEIGNPSYIKSWSRDYKNISRSRLLKLVNIYRKKFHNTIHHRMKLWTSDLDMIKKICKEYYLNIDIGSDISLFEIEFLMDGMPVYSMTNRDGDLEFFDFHKNMFDIGVGDAVYNIRDNRYYIRRGCKHPDTYMIGMQLWDLHDDAGIVSYIDLRKVSKKEFDDYRLGELNYVVNEVKSIEEDMMLIDKLCEEVPRLDYTE